jgi:DNA-binding response OmpR family regulator
LLAITGDMNTFSRYNPLEKPSDRSKLNIVIVSPDTLLSWSLIRAFEKEGHNTHLFNRECEFGDSLLFEDDSVDCMLLDHDPPEFDVNRCISKVKLLSPETPLIIIGSIVEQEREEIERLRTFGTFVEKPFRINEILNRIHEIQREKA